MNYLSKNVQFLAARAGISQDDLGKAAGVTQPSVSRMVRESVDPRLSTVQKVAAFFRVSLDELVSKDIEVDGFGSPSQSTGLDPAVLESAGEVAEAIAGKKVDPRADARLIALAYSRIVELAGKPIPTAVIVEITQRAQEWGYGGKAGGSARVSG